MPRFFTLTLGCRTNQYDTAASEEALLKAGFDRADTPESAEVLLLFTCAVTERAIDKSAQAARKLGRQAAGKTLVLAGCAARSDRERFENIPGVAGVFGVNAVQDIVASVLKQPAPSATNDGWSPPLISPLTKFIEGDPMKPATNRLTGRL